MCPQALAISAELSSHKSVLGTTAGLQWVLAFHYRVWTNDHPSLLVATCLAIGSHLDEERCCWLALSSTMDGTTCNTNVFRCFACALYVTGVACLCLHRCMMQILEVMTDDSISLCLSPQGFSNVNPATDIYNNNNQQFWE
jgi:hypothetical protein